MMSSCCDDDNNILPSSCFPTAGSQAEGVQAWRQAWIPVILQGLRSPDEHLRHRVSLYGVPVPLSLDQASVLPLLQQVMALQAGQHAASDSQVPLPPTPPRAPPPPPPTPPSTKCVCSSRLDLRYSKPYLLTRTTINSIQLSDVVQSCCSLVPPWPCALATSAASGYPPPPHAPLSPPSLQASDSA